jgi:hypothetical protein
MDASGRFQLEDGVNFANVINNIAEQGKAADFQSQTDNYLNRIGKGENIDPKEEGYNYRAHLTASAMQLKTLSADQSVQKQRFELNEAQRTENQADIDTRIVKANDLIQRGRKDEALDALVPIYQYLPDGQTIKGFKTDKDGNVDRSKLVLIAEDGKTEYEEPAPDLDSAMKMALNFSKSYKDIYHQSIQRASEVNLKNLQNHQIWSSKDGKEAIYVPFVDVDKTGNYTLKETWKDPATGETLKGFDESTGKEVESKIDFRPPAYWKQEDEKKRSKLTAQSTEADIAAKEQTTRINKEQAPLKNELTRAQTDLAKKKASEATKPAGYKNDLDAIKTLAKPFLDERSGDVLSPDNALTPSGRNAIEKASALIKKHRNAERMTPAEKDLVQHAYRLVTIYNRISDRIASEYGEGENWRNYQ